MSQEIAIRAEHLTKHFGEGENMVDVLDDASFEIKKGELVALIAPSGAGKTTLLMMLGCVTEPTSGKIWLGQDSVWDEDHWSIKDPRKIRRQKIGFIFQAHYLIPFLNVIENVTLVPQTNDVPPLKADQKAMELLQYLGIESKAYVMPSQLSGGQNQRVAIARALANKPKIILADEPTAALDLEQAYNVMRMLQKVTKEQNVSIIMVTHDERMLSYCDSVMSIENKKIKYRSIEEFTKEQTI